MLMAVDEIGQVAERIDEGGELRGDFDIANSSGCKRCSIAMRIFCVFGRKQPARSG